MSAAEIPEMDSFLQQLLPNIIHIFDHSLNTLHTLLPDSRILLLNRRSVRNNILATLRKDSIQVLALLSGEALRLEEDIHVLKLHALGLGQEEESEGHAANNGASEEELWTKVSYTVAICKDYLAVSVRAQ